MARMFDTDFNYRNETYTATVVISGDDDGKTLAIEVPEALQEIVPEKKIVVEHYSEGEKPAVEAAKDPALVESILAAVDKHEEAAPPVGNLWS